MSKFNAPKTAPEPDTTNREGFEAFDASPKYKLASLLFTSFLESQFYRSANEQIDEIQTLVREMDDKLFAAKTALAARVKWHMRSTSHVVAGEIGRTVKGEQWTKEFFHRVVLRADDMTEIVSYYLAHEDGGLPMAMRKGFARALRDLDEYEVAKYAQRRHEVSLHDVVNLVRPEPTEAINKLMNDELDAADTWETGLMQADEAEDTEQAREETWDDLLSRDKLGYMATLKNLRNIAEDAGGETLDKALDVITDPERVKHSRILPFRFMTAMDAIQQTVLDRRSDIVQALEEAINIATENVPTFDGRVLVAVDDSSSMHGNKLSEYGSTSPADVASLFAAILARQSDADVIQFSSDARYTQVDPNARTMSIATRLRQDSRARSTNFESIFQTARKAYDYIIILSDMQAWDQHRPTTQALREYKRDHDADPVVFSFDLAGYGTLQFPEDGVVAVAGFSENVFDLMDAATEGPERMFDEIESFDLGV